MSKKPLKRSRVNAEIEQMKALLEQSRSNYSSLSSRTATEIGGLNARIQLLQKVIDQANQQLAANTDYRSKMTMLQGQIAGMREILSSIDQVKLRPTSLVSRVASVPENGVATAPAEEAFLKRMFRD